MQLRREQWTVVGGAHMSSPERGMELPIGEEDIGQVDPVSSD